MKTGLQAGFFRISLKGAFQMFARVGQMALRLLLNRLAKYVHNCFFALLKANSLPDLVWNSLWIQLACFLQHRFSAAPILGRGFLGLFQEAAENCVPELLNAPA